MSSAAPDILVVGAGAWGTALASVFARGGCRTQLWDSDAELVATLARTRRHPRFEDAGELEPLIEPIAGFDAARDGADAVFVVPYQVLAQALATLRDAGAGIAGIACASKGFELATQRLAHEIVAGVWPQGIPFAQLSGPNFAAEVLAGLPAAITIGASDAAFGERLANAMHGASFRPYVTDDVVGVEVGGALKNVIAIAAGIADGLGLGSNTRAALITRGLREISRLGVALGGRTETFMGLSGMGDLVLTCTDDQSRNRRFGLALARCGDVEQAAAAVGALVEGVSTARAVGGMAAARGIDMPILGEVLAVLDGERAAATAVERLLAREPVSENA